MARETKKVLVAEDEKPIAKAFQLKLESVGFSVQALEDGVEAIEALKKGSFDLVLLDLVMPNQNGIDVLAEMQRQKLVTPVIIVTNLSQAEDLEKVEQFKNVRGYFVKSETPIADIVERAKKLLGS